MGQLLSAPRPPSIGGVLAGLGSIQVDPTAVVARTEHLVLWSRLGPYDLADLEAAVYRNRTAFEYLAHIVPTADYAVHREAMRRFPGDSVSRSRVRDWMAANHAFRDRILAEVRERGPLRSRDLEDTAAVPWRSAGWNDGKNLGRMLDFLWMGGQIAISARAGGERLWDLAERVLPVHQPELGEWEEARRLAELQLRSRGLSSPREIGIAFMGVAAPGRDSAVAGLVEDGVAVRARIESQDADLLVHRDLLAQSFAPRATLLSPFDRLIYDRKRTSRLFDFDYKLEMYTPRRLRVHGYYVLAFLNGDRLAGRIDPAFDRTRRVLTIHSIGAEDPAGESDGRALSGAVQELAQWLGAERIAWPAAPPTAWRRAIPAGSVVAVADPALGMDGG